MLRAQATRNAEHAPRALTADARRELGLPEFSVSPYPWAFASLVVALACIPLALASLFKACLVGALVGLVILPAFRWFEHRDAAWREAVYRFGTETRGRVLDVEPAGPGRADHIVRVEFRADEEIVRTSVLGCPLARRGLMPDDEVVILYAAARPTRCIVVRRVVREIVDAAFEENTPA